MFRVCLLLLTTPTLATALKTEREITQETVTAAEELVEIAREVLPEIAHDASWGFAHEIVFVWLFVIVVVFSVGALVGSQLERHFIEETSNIRAVTPYDNVMLPTSGRQLDEEQAKTRFYRLLCLIAPDLDAVTPGALDSLLIQHLPGFCKYRRCLVDLFAFGYVDQSLRHNSSPKLLPQLAAEAAERTGLQKNLVLWGAQTWRLALRHNRRGGLSRRVARKRARPLIERSPQLTGLRTA